MKKCVVLFAITGSLLFVGCSHTVKDCDGNEYNTVEIGEQVWMAENLRAKHFTDGTEIPGVFDVSKYDFLIATDNKKMNLSKKKCGLYYSSEVVIDERNICPKGWHIPSVYEYKRMLRYLVESKCACGKNEQNIAKALAGTEGWAQGSPEECDIGYNPITTNNLSGFSAYPAGYMSLVKRSDGSYEITGPFGVQNIARFWTHTHPEGLGRDNGNKDGFWVEKDKLLILNLTSSSSQPDIYGISIEGEEVDLCNIRCVKD